MLNNGSIGRAPAMVLVARALPTIVRRTERLVNCRLLFPSMHRDFAMMAISQNEHQHCMWPGLEVIF